VVSCQDEKSQHKNKAKALKILRARLMDKAQQEKQMEISEKRRNQVGTGERSERIRTYNFPQGRVTDHRIGLTLYRLESILEGEIGEIIGALTTHYQTEALKREGEGDKFQFSNAR
jgi:peptide chain release factor 1